MNLKVGTQLLQSVHTETILPVNNVFLYLLTELYPVIFKNA
jgi:hypothetical protein